MSNAILPFPGKKGDLFHWIIFGILAALGVFFSLMQNTDVGVTTKGDWQLSFLQNYYLPGEQELIATDQAALGLGKEMIPLLAEKAGFVEDSPCETLEGVQYWNKKEQFCFPDIEDSLNTLFATLSPGYFGETRNYIISFDGQELVGKAEQKITVESSGEKQGRIALYYIYPHFRVDTGYDFWEYQKVQDEAVQLLYSCREEQDLQACLASKKKESWKFSDCAQEEFKEQERRVPFCVMSQYTLFNTVGENVPVAYLVGLDFSPVEAFEEE